MRSGPFPSFTSSGFFRALLLPAAAGVLLLLALSGCGSGGTAAAASASASPSPGASAYFACLQQHGVTVPTTRPTVRPTAFPSGGFATPNPTMQKAREACASLRPAGGFGGFGGRGFGQAFEAFRSCMADHGETIPTTRPTAPPTPAPSPGTDRFLNGLNPGNPKVAAALKACESKLPSFAGGTSG